MALASIYSNIALVAIIVLTLNLITVKIFQPTQAAAAQATFKIISNQHKSRDTAADLTPQHTSINQVSTTQFDDDHDDGEGEQLRDVGVTYTLVPRDTRGEPTPRFHWPSSSGAQSLQPAARASTNASARLLSKLLNRDTRLRYKVHAQRTLNSSHQTDEEPNHLLPATIAAAAADLISATGQAHSVGALENCLNLTNERAQEQAHLRRQNKKFLKDVATKRGLLEPILLLSDVKVRSDLVLVRDQEETTGGGDKHTSYENNRVDTLLGSLPVKTLSQRVEVVLPSRGPAQQTNQLDQQAASDYGERDNQKRDENEKIFISRPRPGSSVPKLIGQQLNEQIKSSLGEDDEEEMPPSATNNVQHETTNNELDRTAEVNLAQQTEELTRAADTRRSSLVTAETTLKPAWLTVKRKYGLQFGKPHPPAAVASGQRDTSAPLPQQQLRSAPTSTSGIRVTVGDGTRPLVVNSRGLITAAKNKTQTGGAPFANLHGTNASRPYNPMQLFASSQTSQTLNPIETMATRRPGVKKKPAASIISKQPTRPIEHKPVHHSHHVDSSYTLSPVAISTNLNHTHQSNANFFGEQFNRTSGIIATTTTTTTSGNFHHNPPYQQHHLEHSSTTPTFTVATPPPPTPTPVRPNNRFQSTGGGGGAASHHHQQQPIRFNGGAHNVTRNQQANRTTSANQAPKRPSLSPYEPGTVDLLSEPANTLQFNLRPNTSSSSSQLAHLQQTLATTSLKPTKMRIKLLHSLFGGAKPQKTQLAANQTSTATSLHSSGSPAPLLSSTVANNVAALLAQKLTSLVRPPSLPLNNLFGFRVGSQQTPAAVATGASPLGQSFSAGKLKHPFAGAASQASSPINFGINRRTTGVGSLLVSGLIYGLTVLPALMALTGINPLSSTTDSSGSATLAANRQQHQQHQSSEKRSRQAKPTKQRPGRDTTASHMLGDSTMAANSDAFAYLLPLLSASQSADAANQLAPNSLSQLATAVESTRATLGESGHPSAQSSALKSLYAPAPTVLDPFSGTSGADLSSLLEEQPAAMGEIEWPPGAGGTSNYPMPVDDSHQYRRPSSQYQRLGQPASSSWPDDSERGGSFVRRNRDLPHERGQWQTTSGGNAGRSQPQADYASATTTTTPQPPSASFDDRSANTTTTSFQPQQASRHVSQVASPPMLANQQQQQQQRPSAYPNSGQQSWSVGMTAPNGGAHHGAAHQQVAQSDHRFRQQVSYLVGAQNQQLRQQQQLAQLGDSEGEFAILGPYRPPILSTTTSAAASSQDFGGLRRRRTAVAKMPPLAPASGQLMNLTANDERPWQGDSWTSLSDKSSRHQHHHLDDKSVGILSQAQSHRMAAPNWTSESDWRAMGPPAPPSRSPTMSPSSSSRRDDMLFDRSQTERSAPSGVLGAKKKINKKKNSSAKRKRLSNLHSGNHAAAKSTTTRAPNDKDDSESELIMAHSMAMGSRVLNEQLTGHHH